MKVNLEAQGAHPLPEGSRYRVHVYEVYENRVDVKVSILQKYKRKLFGVIPFPLINERTVASGLVSIPRLPDGTASVQGIVDEANFLYDYFVRNKMNE